MEFTKEEYEAVAEEFVKKWTSSQLSSEKDLAKSIVKKCILASEPIKVIQEPEKKVDVIIDRKYKKFTSEEISAIKQHHSQGMSAVEIHKQYFPDRSYASIYRYCTLGIKTTNDTESENVVVDSESFGEDEHKIEEHVKFSDDYTEALVTRWMPSKSGKFKEKKDIWVKKSEVGLDEKIIMTR